MSLKSWSTTAADNATVGSINWAEGQNPNTVNNSARQEMADVREFYENIEWRDWGHTPTRTGNTTFTVTGDQTSVYTVGRRIQCTDSSTLYGTITASAYTTLTTVTVSLDSGNLSASLSAVALGIDPTNNPFASVTVEETCGANATGFDISTNIGSTFESVGPTGAGATNTWTALDDVPSGAGYVILKLYMLLIEGGTSNGQAVLYAESAGEGISLATARASVQAAYVDQSSSAFNITTVFVPVDASNSFDLALSVTGAGVVDTVEAYLVGWG